MRIAQVNLEKVEKLKLTLSKKNKFQNIPKFQLGGFISMTKSQIKVLLPTQLKKKIHYSLNKCLHLKLF